MKATQNTKEVTDFIKNSTHPFKKGIEALRQIILGANKKITEHIMWNAPSFRFGGEDRVTLHLSKKDSIIIVFHRGAKVKDSKGFVFKDDAGLFEWKTPDRATVTLHSIKEIEDTKAALKKVVSKWMKVTAE